eukprot:1791507-Rhodomonas_salina.3
MSGRTLVQVVWKARGVGAYGGKWGRSKAQTDRKRHKTRGSGYQALRGMEQLLALDSRASGIMLG